MTKTEHKVYWTQDGHNLSKDFGPGMLDECLKECERLRQLRKSGIDISFITIASEIADCVSLQGVDVVGVGYNWKKRRP